MPARAGPDVPYFPRFNMLPLVEALKPLPASMAGARLGREKAEYWRTQGRESGFYRGRSFTIPRSRRSAGLDLSSRPDVPVLHHLGPLGGLHARMKAGELLARALPSLSWHHRVSSFSCTSGIAALLTSSFIFCAIAVGSLPGPTSRTRWWPRSREALLLHRRHGGVARLVRVCAIAATLPLFTCGVAGSWSRSCTGSARPSGR